MLGLQIVLLRKKAGLSQQQLAERLHLSGSAVGMYEQGRRQPSVDILVALSLEFGVTLEYLMIGDRYFLSSERDLLPALR